MTTLVSEKLRLEVSSTGAEMQRLTDLCTGRQLLWHGDARYWASRSPILFPSLGRSWGDVWHVGGRTYPMPKHGLVRRREWQLACCGADHAVFATATQGDDLEHFPWPYRLRVGYTLRGASVEVGFEVDNAADEPMYFLMGGHPGLALPAGPQGDEAYGYVRLEGDVRWVRRVGQQGCAAPERRPVPLTADGLVPVSVSTFADEALIFDGGQVGSATLLDADRRPLVRLESSAPTWLLWTPPGLGAPFVCIEPWYGLCGEVADAGDISTRPGANRLEPGATWRGGFTLVAL